MVKTIIATVALVAVLCTPIFAGNKILQYDEARNGMQSFVPDPSKSQVNSRMRNKVVFSKNGKGDVDIHDWMIIRVHPYADTSYYYNDDSDKTYPMLSDTDNLIFVLQPNVKSVTIMFGNYSAAVQGM